MNLLFYAEKLAPGGAQVNAVNLAASLTERGHSVWFAADTGSLESRLRSRGIQYIRVPYRSEKHPSVRIMRQLASAARTHNIDVVQAFEYYPIVEAYAVCLWMRKPVYGIAAMQAIPAQRLPKSRELGLVSPATKAKYVEHLGWDPSKLRLIVARLDCEYYRPHHPARTRTLAEYGVGVEDNVALLVTRVNEDKWRTIDMFLNAAEHWRKRRPELPPVKFVIAGDGPLGPRLRERAARSSDDGVVATGELDDIPAAMNGAGVVLGMASSCQQGLACGRPVIVLGDRGFSAVISPENFDYLAYHHFNLHTQSSSGQPEELCQQIERVVFSPQVSHELGRFGRAIALERFDSRRGACELEEIYDGLLAADGATLRDRMGGWADLALTLVSLYTYRAKRKIRTVGKPARGELS